MAVGAYSVMSELAAPYDRRPTEQRRSSYRTNMVVALAGLIITLVIFGVLWFFRRWDHPVIWALIGIHLGIAVVRFGYFLTRWLVARKVLKEIPDGTALLVDRRGIALSGLAVPWSEVDRVSARTPALWNSGVLELRAGQRTSKLRVDQVPAELSRIASAVEVFSAGTQRLNVAKLDR